MKLARCSSVPSASRHGWQVIEWDKAQEIAALLAVVKENCRRDVLQVLLKGEGFHLTRTVPADQLMDAHKLAEFLRVYSRRSN